MQTHAIVRTIVALILSPLLLAAGCGTDARTSNQGGGNILTTGIKVNNGELTSLTPDEIQIIGDQLSNFVPDAPDVELTDEQAEVISQVLEENGINTIEDAIALGQNPGDIVLPDEFLDLFTAF